MLFKDEKRVNEILLSSLKLLIRDGDLSDDVIRVLTDNMLYSHSLGVAQFSIQLGISYNLSEQELMGLARAGFLHDVGKLFIDRKVLYKPDRLTDAEFTLVKEHPALGYQHIKEFTEDRMILEAVRHHHEKLSGKGYPDAIANIDFTTEIITVADIFSALTEVRVYKKSMFVSKAFEIMEGDEGLNQEIVSVLKESIFDEYEATIVARKFANYYRHKLAA